MPMAKSPVDSPCAREWSHGYAHMGSLDWINDVIGIFEGLRSWMEPGIKVLEGTGER